ncbi:MAG: phosphate signaling complex protein PhoU [Anaerolineales bacterium]|nr:phosphate signaling complex protein PhoU [Anaerolineales bacterium]
MTRNLFEQQLQRLQDEILELGSSVDQSLLEVVAALRRRDLATARRLEAHDEVINRKRFAIEEDCLTLIATQQPMARDLRILAAILEVITELERMGDYVKGIAHIITLLGPEPLPPDLLDHFDGMASQATKMLRRSLEAFIAGDARASKAIPAGDDEVDKLYNLVYRELLKQMIADPDSIDHATHLLWVAHNLERFADRVSNICERTLFFATGEMMEIRSTDDQTKHPTYVWRKEGPRHTGE